MARSFNGTSDSILMSGFSTPASDQTYAVWVYISSSGANQAMFGSGSAGNTGGPEFRFNNATGKLEFLAENVSSIGTSTGTVTKNVWTHVLVTYNNTTFGTGFFINGVAAGTPASAVGLTSGRTLSLGQNAVGSNEFFGGNMFDAGVWNRQLDSNEIQALGKYNARPGSVPGGLIGWWPLAGLQSPEPDLSGSGNSGTLTGTGSASDPPVFNTRFMTAGAPLIFT